MVLAAGDGLDNLQITRELGVDDETPGHWRRRWLQFHDVPPEDVSVAKRLADAPKPGAPPKFTPKQACRIIALAYQRPGESDRPVSHWSHRELADEILWRGIVESISPRHAGGLQEAELKPHLIRYWLPAAAEESPEDRAQGIADMCRLYREAPARVATGERVLSIDEMTGVQALERAAPSLPLRAGKVERRAFEYIRDGTLSSMINFDVARGAVGRPSVGPTRTEADFHAHIRQTVESEPSVSRWHVVSDNLNTHCSETLVQSVAALSGVTDDLGIKEKCGTLKSIATRAAFLMGPAHKVVFHYPPKHAYWLKQVELWLSISVRQLLRRGNFTSVDDLRSSWIRSKPPAPVSSCWYWADSVITGDTTCQMKPKKAISSPMVMRPAMARALPTLQKRPAEGSHRARLLPGCGSASSPSLSRRVPSACRKACASSRVRSDDR